MLTSTILYCRGNQWWKYQTDTQLLKHVVSRKCLSLAASKDKFVMEECDPKVERLRWEIQNYNQTVIDTGE